MEMYFVMKSRSMGQSMARSLALSVAAWMLSAAVQAEMTALSLEQAETIALRADPSVQAVESRRDALEELAVASGQLPDPVLRAGFMSLPVDTWQLGQEPMTQVQVGVGQKFPRGRTRALRSEQITEQSRALTETVREQKLRILLAVREEYLEVLKQIRLAEVNAAAISAFTDLADITQDYYATGRVQQQDVLRAAVELAKVEDRATRIAQDEDRARARLETWVGTAAYGKLDSEWPELDSPDVVSTIVDRLAEHPRIAALLQEATASETGIELAEQRYKPEFGVELTYGGRGGNNPDGSSRSDLFSVMVMMDLPLFHENRQDRYKAAAVSESAAALLNRDDMLRRMRSEASVHVATLHRQMERRRIFEESLLPEAEFNAEAALSAYQAALDSLTTLRRARITEFEVQLDFATLLAELQKTRARLLYLTGE
jgi:outer membrane protein TolC